MIKLVWKVYACHVGTLVWGSYVEAKEDYNTWKRDGHVVKIWPAIMTTKRFETMKEFRGP